MVSPQGPEDSPLLFFQLLFFKNSKQDNVSCRAVWSVGPMLPGSPRSLVMNLSLFLSLFLFCQQLSLFLGVSASGRSLWSVGLLGRSEFLLSVGGA